MPLSLPLLWNPFQISAQDGGRRAEWTVDRGARRPLGSIQEAATPGQERPEARENEKLENAKEGMEAPKAKSKSVGAPKEGVPSGSKRHDAR